MAQYASDAPAAALRRRSGLSGLRYAGRHRALELTQPARAPLLVTTAVAPRPVVRPAARRPARPALLRRALGLGLAATAGLMVVLAVGPAVPVAAGLLAVAPPAAATHAARHQVQRPAHHHRHKARSGRHGSGEYASS